MMDQLIARFPEQQEEALQIADKAKITSHDHKIHKVYVAGLGGSGIGADFVSEFIRDECKIPYTVGKGYSIPAYVDQNTLAIASSYSGNTEETLYSFEQIEKSGAKIVIISSGGKLIEIAKVISPNSKHEIIGIRPGEKLHEQMISSEDSYSTFEYSEYYKILPQINNWEKDDSRIKNGIKVPEGFNYSSDNNTDWMTKSELSDWITQNKNKIGKI